METICYIMVGIVLGISAYQILIILAAAVGKTMFCENCPMGKKLTRKGRDDE